MGAALANTARGVNNILSNRIAIDMANDIALLKPRVNPLTVITKKLNTKSCNSYKFEWMEDDIMARWTSCPAGAASGAATVALNAGDGALVAVGDILKNPATGELVRVTAIAVDSLTVTRGYGETATAAIAAGQKLLVVANAIMQGDVAPAEKYLQPTAVYNYTQIFKTPFSVTNTLDATKLYGGAELARLRSRKGVEHAMSLEYAMLFGERKFDTSGAQPLSTTAGVIKFLTGTPNAKSVSRATANTAALQQAALDSWCETLFTYGSPTKTWFCAPSIITWVNQIAQSKVQVINADNDKTFGLDIIKYQSPHGTLNIVMHPLLINGYTDFAFALDLDSVSYRPLKGRDTKLLPNVQNNDEDGVRDMYLTEAGLELKLPASHGILKLT